MKNFINKKLGIGGMQRLASKLLVPLFLIPVLFACQQQHDHQAEEAAGVSYTCPMHPQVVAEEPGSCPICGMDLVPMSRGGTEAVGLSEELDYLLRPVSGTVVSSIKTVRPELDEKSVAFSFPGVIRYDTRNEYTIPARFGGRIEELYVTYNFQPVRKGQKLLEIYSPELLTNQRELLFLLEEDPENKTLIEAAKQKLRLLGLTEAQLKQLVQSGQEQSAVAVYSPYDGYVLEATAAESGGPGKGLAGSGSMGGMGGSAVPSASAADKPSRELAIREGMYVDAGQALFKVIDPSQLWAEFTVYAAESSRIQPGDPIEISWGGGEEQALQTRVSFVQPFFNEGESFAAVRAYVSGRELSLRVGQLVEGEIISSTEESLWVPVLSVLDLGDRKVVFQQLEPGVFKPMLVQTGMQAGDQLQIVGGLSAGDAIAYNAQFLVDSESFVRIAD